jgi:ketosteroid isomerase-like protein
MCTFLTLLIYKQNQIPMKRILVPAVAIIIIALASCSPPAPAVDTVGEQNKEIVKKYMDALLSGNVAGAGELLADDFKGRGPALMDSLNKQQQIDNWTKNWAEQFSAVKFDQTAVLATTVKEGPNAGDWVLNWGTISVDYKDARPSVKFLIQLTSRVANGKIAFSIAYYDVADILTQQGFTFTPPAKEEAKK